MTTRGNIPLSFVLPQQTVHEVLKFTPQLHGHSRVKDFKSLQPTDCRMLCAIMMSNRKWLKFQYFHDGEFSFVPKFFNVCWYTHSGVDMWSWERGGDYMLRAMRYGNAFCFQESSRKRKSLVLSVVLHAFVWQNDKRATYIISVLSAPFMFCDYFFWCLVKTTRKRVP